jgi:hypothetical protein
MIYVLVGCSLDGNVTLLVGKASGLSKRISQIAGFAATIAAIVPIGRWAGLPLLSSWSSGFPSMTPLGVLGLAAWDSRCCWC